MHEQLNLENGHGIAPSDALRNMLCHNALPIEIWNSDFE